MQIIPKRWGRKTAQTEHNTPLKQLNFFVGHKPPEFGLWPSFQYFSPKESNRIHELPDPRLADSRKFSEYSSLFLLKRELESQSCDTITIAQYRRFTLSKNIGKSANGLDWTRVIPSAHTQLHELYALTRPVHASQLLLPPPVLFYEHAGMIQQYADAHPIQDLLQFSTMLVDTGIFSNKETTRFLLQNALLPACSCATLPSSLFFSIYDTLEKAALGHLRQGHREHDDPYQARSCAFLLERLHSHLLLEYIQKQQITTKKIFGFLTVVSDDTQLKSSTADGTLVLRDPNV